MDVAVAMGGGTYYIPMPTMTRINLTGYLKPWVSAKDVILEVLRRMTVKGGVGKIIEYGGEGVKDPACLTMTTESLTRVFPLYTPSLLNLVKTSETHVKGLTHEG